ncbi:hypothetical protein WAI453_000914 [Rhynchosporium graminicola]
MALVAQRPFQPEVNTAPPSPTSSVSTTVHAPRPVEFDSSGLRVSTPIAKERDSEPKPTPEPTTVPDAAVATTPIPITNPTQTSPTAELPPAPKLVVNTSTITPTPPRSILKAGDIHQAKHPSADPPTTTPSSLNHTSKAKPDLNPKSSGKRSRGKSIKEGAFYAFVLLPLSCWYTRGGKNLGTAAPTSAEGKLAGRKSEMLDLGDDSGEENDDDEDERRVRVSSTQEVRRSMHSRKNSVGQAGTDGVTSNANVAGRRQSFNASVPAGVVVGSSMGHGKSNSFSSMRGGGAGSGFGAQRKEFADYGVDKGAAAVNCGDMDLGGEMDGSRLSRKQTRTGSPAPLRRRLTDV